MELTCNGRPRTVPDGTTVAELLTEVADHDRGIAVAVDGTVTLSPGATPVGLFVDRLGAVMLLLVLGVSAVVQSFAVRYLRSDPAGPRFVAATGALTSARAARDTTVL